jgi:tight adherence protein C
MIALLAGALAGLGGYLVYLCWAPTARPLADTAAVLRQGNADVDDLSLGARLRVQALSLAHLLGIDRVFPASIGADLKIVDRTSDQHLTESLAGGLVGLVAGPIVAWLLSSTGSASVTLPAFVSIAFGAVGFFFPTLRLRPRADALRRSLLHALSAFVDGAFLATAAGEGVDDALREAARAGDGWAFELLQRQIDASDRRKEELWRGLDRLGRDIEVPEIQDLAISLRLTGAHGAPVSLALGAKARSLRERQATEVEGRALEAAERMAYPIALLTLGCLLYLGYPAIANVMGTFK